MNNYLRTMFLHISLDSFFTTDVQFAVRWQQQIEPLPVVVGQSAAQETAAPRNQYLSSKTLLAEIKSYQLYINYLSY